MTEKYIDARGLICPIPVLKARKVLLSMNKGDILKISVTDKNAPGDFKLFCSESGYILKDIITRQDSIEIVIAY